VREMGTSIEEIERRCRCKYDGDGGYILCDLHDAAPHMLRALLWILFNNKEGEISRAALQDAYAAVEAAGCRNLKELEV